MYIKRSSNFQGTGAGFGFMTKIEEFAVTLNTALKNTKNEEILRDRSLNFSIEKGIKNIVAIYSNYEPT